MTKIETTRQNLKLDLLLACLRSIDTRLDRIEGDIAELKTCVAQVQGQLAEVDGRLRRVRGRLELTEALGAR